MKLCRQPNHILCVYNSMVASPKFKNDGYFSGGLAISSELQRAIKHVITVDQHQQNRIDFIVFFSANLFMASIFYVIDSHKIKTSKLPFGSSAIEFILLQSYIINRKLILKSSPLKWIFTTLYIDYRVPGSAFSPVQCNNRRLVIFSYLSAVETMCHCTVFYLLSCQWQ